MKLDLSYRVIGYIIEIDYPKFVTYFPILKTFQI